MRGSALLPRWRHQLNRNSLTLAELMAWFWTEGWIGGNGEVTLTQSGAVNAQHVTRIRAALTELFGPDAKVSGRSLLGSKGREKRVAIRAELDRDPDRSNREIARACSADGHTVALIRAGKTDGPGWTEDIDGRGISHFRLNAQAGAVLTEHAPGKVDSTEFLASLTRAQLELFYQVSVDADGTRRPGGRGATMLQKDRARLEAFQVACALTGRSGVIRGPNAAGMRCMSVQVTPWRKPKGHAEYESRETVPLVWCVQTPTRNGTTYFTSQGVALDAQCLAQLVAGVRAAPPGGTPSPMCGWPSAATTAPCCARSRQPGCWRRSAPTTGTGRSADG